MLEKSALAARDRMNKEELGDYFCPLIDKSCRSRCISFVPREVMRIRDNSFEDFIVSKSGCTYFKRAAT